MRPAFPGLPPASGIPLALAAAPLAAGAAFLGAGALMRDRLLTVRRTRSYSHDLLAVEDGTVELARSRAAARPGTYGLAWEGGHAVVGEVVELRRQSVVRELVRVDQGVLGPGKVAVDHVDVGDPRTAFGFEFEEVELESDVGRLPAWSIPAGGQGGDEWVILVHGYGGRRASGLSFVPMLRRLGLSVFVPAYRNDPDAPPSPDRRYHLGASEWRDLEAAIGHVTGRGATGIALYGWSMGAQVVLRAFGSGAGRDLVRGIVLDSPVLDWREVMLHLGRARRVPDALSRLTMRLVERSLGVGLDELDWLRRAGDLDVPVLVVHGDEDETVPSGPSARLAALRPDVVTLRLVAGAGHVGSWNLDPAGYEVAVGEFLRSVGAVPGALPGA